MTAQDAAIPTTAQVRVLNGSPDAPSMDLVVNGVRLFGNLPFGMSSPYISVPVGEQVVQLVQSGAALADSPVLVETSVPFVGDTRSTIVVSNTADALEATVASDATDVKKKSAQLRVGHLSADAPNVDVAADGAAAKDALLKDVPYLTVSDYLRVKPGKLDLDVREPGTEDGHRRPAGPGAGERHELQRLRHRLAGRRHVPGRPARGCLRQAMT